MISVWRREVFGGDSTSVRSNFIASELNIRLVHYIHITRQ